MKILLPILLLACCPSWIEGGKSHRYFRPIHHEMQKEYVQYHRAVMMYFALKGDWDEDHDSLKFNNEPNKYCDPEGDEHIPGLTREKCVSVAKMNHFLKRKWIPGRTMVSGEDKFVTNDDLQISIVNGHWWNPGMYEGEPYMPLMDLVAYIKSRPREAVPRDVRTLLMKKPCCDVTCLCPGNIDSKWPGSLMPRSAYKPIGVEAKKYRKVNGRDYHEFDMVPGKFPPGPPPQPPHPGYDAATENPKWHVQPGSHHQKHGHHEGTGELNWKQKETLAGHRARGVPERQWFAPANRPPAAWTYSPPPRPPPPRPPPQPEPPMHSLGGAGQALPTLDIGGMQPSGGGGGALYEPGGSLNFLAAPTEHVVTAEEMQAQIVADISSVFDRPEATGMPAEFEGGGAEVAAEGAKAGAAESEEEREERLKAEVRAEVLEELAEERVQWHPFLASSMWVAMFLMGMVFPVYGLYMLYQAMGSSVSKSTDDPGGPSTITDTWATMMRFQLGGSSTNRVTAVDRTMEAANPRSASEYYFNRFRNTASDLEQSTGTSHAVASVPQAAHGIVLSSSTSVAMEREAEKQRQEAYAKREKTLEEVESIYRPVGPGRPKPLPAKASIL